MSGEIYNGKVQDSANRARLGGYCALACLSFLLLPISGVAAGDDTDAYRPVPGKFGLSKWAAEVTPNEVLPEYPRPQMVREQWMNLNGQWDYSVVAKEAASPESYQGRILVPFCIESPLSGVGKMINSIPGRTYANSRLWYRRHFQIPEGWKGKRILLHFGAVDWEAVVYLNGHKLGTHRGGYDEFSFDITDALKKTGADELVLAVWDPTSEDQYACGKQTCKPGGIFYTPCTGIWQTVWLEPVATAASIRDLTIVPDIDNESVRVTVSVHPDSADLAVHLTAMDGQENVSQAVGRPGEEIELRIAKPRLWWPDEPFLYGLKVDLVQTTQNKGQVDTLESYFGMRKSSLGKDKKGITRMMLNNKFIVQNGLLDQGFWPGGIYTAPTDEALRYDIEATKRLGFNMARKHLKVEPQRWYYWADKLGLLVWQDMPSITRGPTPPAQREQFMHEYSRMVRGRFNHPSIVSWVLFNEGMGLRSFDLKAVTAQAAKMDTTRLLNHENGAGGSGAQGKNKYDVGAGDLVDFHCYNNFTAPVPEANRAAVIGEYGPGVKRFMSQLARYAPMVADPGVSGFVWTQTTDVENERNGMMTYDRSTFNDDPEKLRSHNLRHFGQMTRHASKDVVAKQPGPEAFLSLPPGAVEPQGWLRDWAMSMRNGLTGHLDEYDPVFRLGWLGKRIGAAGESGSGEGWPLEQAAYWIDGAVRLGHVLHDDALLAKVLPRLEKIAGTDNHHGSYLWWREKFSWDGKNGPPVEGFNLWSCGVLGRAMIAQYQATGDRKWLACIERFFAAMPGESMFPIGRPTVNIETIFEASRLGEDPRIWARVADEARRRMLEDGDWSRGHYWAGMRPKDAEHGVTFNELAKLPLLLYAATRDESFKRATLGRYQSLFEKHMQPYGVNSASERITGVGASRATESCNVSDLIWSQLWLLRILGGSEYADRIEAAFFNAAPACVSRDCRMHVYYQSPNRRSSPSQARGGAAPSNADFARTHKPLCCTGNITRILPNYIIHMWMATPDHGLAANLYGPCTVKATVADGVDVVVRSATDYPFGENITVTVTPSKPARFALHFRVPGWCSEPSFRVDGADVRSPGVVKGYVRIDRTWSKGNTVSIHFPMPPRVVKGRQSDGSPYACVCAGPLLFARGIPEKDENHSMDDGLRHALDFESGQPAGELEIKRSAMPARWDWPYAAPVTIAVPAQLIDGEPEDGAKSVLPKTPVAGKGRETIKLIPYGCAKFRVTMFPVTDKAWGQDK